jgi:hypothetical protein
MADAQDGRIAEFCHDIETYLCKKNDGHLIRVTGPSFDLVSGWAAQGVPFKVACAGIDRCFERYYRKGPRRRPVKIDFCEADVLDVFDQWRRAVGVGQAGAPPGEAGAPAASGGRGPSLPAHLERVVLRLTAARAGGTIGDEFDAIVDRVARELDTARASAGGVRGEARQALIARLAALDAELLRAARASLSAADGVALAREADDELASFRERMTADAFARARDGALARLVRERFNLPTVSYL